MRFWIFGSPANFLRIPTQPVESRPFTVTLHLTNKVNHGAKTIHMDSPLVDGNSIYALQQLAAHAAEE